MAVAIREQVLDGRASKVGVERQRKGRVVSRDLERPGEPDGFAAWLGFHAELTGLVVPPAGTDRREDVARRFAEALAAGYTAEDMRDACRRQALILACEGAFQFLPPRA